jgi:hypothetical protein
MELLTFGLIQEEFYHAIRMVSAFVPEYGLKSKKA